MHHQGAYGERTDPLRSTRPGACSTARKRICASETFSNPTPPRSIKLDRGFRVLKD